MSDETGLSGELLTNKDRALDALLDAKDAERNSDTQDSTVWLHIGEAVTLAILHLADVLEARQS